MNISPKRQKRRIPWKQAETMYNELLNRIGGGEAGICHALGMSNGNFLRYIKEGDLPMVSFLALKQLWSAHQVREEKPEEIPFTKAEVTKLITLAAKADDPNLVVKLANRLELAQ